MTGLRIPGYPGLPRCCQAYGPGHDSRLAGEDCRDEPSYGEAEPGTAAYNTLRRLYGPFSQDSSRLNLYVWKGEGVLQDYDPGMIVAVAPGLDAAKTAVRGVYPRSDVPAYGLERSLEKDPEVVELTGDTSPRAWYVDGGS